MRKKPAIPKIIVGRLTNDIGHAPRLTNLNDAPLFPEMRHRRNRPGQRIPSIGGTRIA